MKNKNIIYFYRDWYYLTEELTIIQKGYVWDWFVNYINDLEPNFPTDEASKGVCIVLKGILKRDLAKWNAEYERRSEAGKKGMEKRWQQSEEITNDNKNNNVINVKQKITNDNKNNIDNDIDIVKDKDIVKEIDMDMETHINSEELQIEIIKSFMQQVEELFNGKISPKNRDIAIKMCETYGSKTALNEIKRNIDKNNPINYANTILQNQNAEKKIVRKSKYLDNWGKDNKEEEQ